MTSPGAVVETILGIIYTHTLLYIIALVHRLLETELNAGFSNAKKN
jgi:hypothetical protein